MSSTLVVEDGSIVEDADSYTTLSSARTYLSKRGLSLATDDAAADIQLRKAFDYLESLRSVYKGSKAESGQQTQWPRKDVWIDCEEFASDAIPTSLRQAQAMIAANIQAGIDIMPTSDGSPFIVRDKVGPIETQYSEMVATSGVPIMRGVDALLEPLLITGASLLKTSRA